MAVRILVLNEVLPTKLRRALEREAKKENVTLNDMACAILCWHYGLNCDLTGPPYRKSAERFRLKAPEQLRHALAIDAAESQGTIRGLVLNILASHYGLAPIGTGRRPRRVT
jgi:predicted HicB family RNase H-like nuclease